MVNGNDLVWGVSSGWLNVVLTLTIEDFNR